jgi:tRNA threonylcarbamoyladenosine biosynthesis protein TsaB
VIVLGLETATEVCAAAVVADGKVLHEARLNQKNVHAEKLLTLIHTVVERSTFRFSDLDCIAVSIGPGSFTGLRIGLSIAKGLVYASGKPLVAVPTLRALAQQVVDGGALDSDDIVLSMIDARRDEVYCQLFRLEEKSVQPLWEERDMTLSYLVDQLSGKMVTVTGNANPKLSKMLLEQMPERAAWFNYAPADVSGCRAGTIALMGERMVRANEIVNPDTIQPKYIKEFYSGVHQH